MIYNISNIEPDLVAIINQIFSSEETPDLRVLRGSQLDLGKLPDTYNKATAIVSITTIEIDTAPHPAIVKLSAECQLKIVAPRSELHQILDILVANLSFSRLVTRSKFKVNPVSISFDTNSPSPQFRSADFKIQLELERQTQPIVSEKIAYPFLDSAM